MNDKRKEEKIMDCCEFNQLLDNYANLTETELSDLESHAAECDVCRGELEFYKAIMSTAAAIPVPDPPADLIDKVNSRIDSLPAVTVRVDSIRNGARQHIRAIMTIAACLAVGLIVGLNNKAIKDRLTDSSTDGVISTSVSVTDSEGHNIEDYEITDVPEPTQAAESTVIAQTTATEQPESKKTPKATAKTTSAPQTAKSGDADKAAPATAAPAVTEEPAPTEEPSDGTTKKKTYVIARGNYHIPDADAATPAPTEAPESVEITGERYQIAMRSYDITEEERKELQKNKLIVNESDIDIIVDCMNKSWIRGADKGYTATTTAFNNFLAMLDANGVYYNYIELSPSTSEVNFTLLAN